MIAPRKKLKRIKDPNMPRVCSVLDLEVFNRPKFSLRTITEVKKNAPLKLLFK
jgi:hypothetical protein